MKTTKQPSWRALRNRFWATDRGVSALEFAILAPFVFGVLLSCVELGMVFIKVSFLEKSMNTVMRSAYINNLNATTITLDDVITEICAELKKVSTCGSNNVLMNIRELETTNTSQIRDDLGGALVYLEFTFLTEPMVPGLGDLAFNGLNIGLNIPKTQNGKIALTASTAFRAKP